MVRYDPSQIHKFASKMYTQATVTVLVWTLPGAIVGLAAGAVWGRAIAGDAGFSAAIALCALLGYVLGQDKAFWYRLQAQTLLCQLQIEYNTRPQVQYPQVS